MREWRRGSRSGLVCMVSISRLFVHQRPQSTQSGLNVLMGERSTVVKFKRFKEKNR